ncbi:MAG: hypothetical protein ACK5XQ_11420 [Flavobacteriales bacterium]
MEYGTQPDNAHGTIVPGAAVSFHHLPGLFQKASYPQEPTLDCITSQLSDLLGKIRNALARPLSSGGILGLDDQQGNPSEKSVPNLKFCF